MRLSVLSIALLVATSPAYGQRRERDRNETDAVTRACSVEDCFREADVREFEIIDRTHVIVYVGSQRCAFHLELRGALCDLSFAPELYFRQANEVPQIVLNRPGNGFDADETAPRVGPRPGDFDSFQIEQRERDDALVCSNDLTIQVHGGALDRERSVKHGDGPVRQPNHGLSNFERHVGHRRPASRVLCRPRSPSAGAADGSRRNRSRRAGRAGDRSGRSRPEQRRLAD